MKYEDLEFFSIDENTNYLFSKFDSHNLYLSLNSEFLKKDINRLNEFRFFKLIINILENENIIIDDKLVSYFLTITKNKSFESEKICSFIDLLRKNEISGFSVESELNLIKKHQSLKIFTIQKQFSNSINFEQQIIDITSDYTSILKLRSYRDIFFDKIIDFSLVDKRFSNISIELLAVFKEELFKIDNEILDFINQIHLKIIDHWNRLKILLNIEEHFSFKNFINEVSLIDYKIWKSKILGYFKSITEEKEFHEKKKLFLTYISCYEEIAKVSYFLNISYLKSENYPLTCEEVNDMIEGINFRKSLEDCFKIQSTDLILKNLYYQLNRYEKISSQKTTIQDFLNVFKLPWSSHTSIIHFELDHPQTQLLFLKMNEILGIKLPFQQVERSKKIKNKNGFIKANSLYSSGSRNKSTSYLPKHGELIIEIVESSQKG